MSAYSCSCTSGTSTTTRWHTSDTTASGSTSACWDSHRMIFAGAGAALGAAVAGIATTVTSAGQTIQWAESPRPQMRRGPIRRAEYGRERVGSRFHGAGLGATYRLNTRHYDKKAEELKKKALDKSLKLLKSWLSDMEYHYLMEEGQLELPSQYEKDTIYIVKKDPHSKVGIAKRPKISCIYQMPIEHTGEACIHIGSQYPTGDRLLANIALLKSDEKEFLDIANVDYYPPRVDRPFQFDPHHIARQRGTNFWFVLLDERGRCNTAFETSRHLQFEHIAHEEVPSESVAIGNDILIPQSGQYFIWSLDMIYAVNRARKFFKNRNRQVAPTANGQIVTLGEPEQENPHNRHGGAGFVATWDPPCPLVQYATETSPAHGVTTQATYTTVRLGH